MTRPVLLDLFCGSGGAAMGYHRAGWDVLGVDIVARPRYPFPMIVADAMTWPLERVDAIHASPPCHDHSPVTGRNRKAAGPKGTGWMLTATVDRLAAQSRPWIVENVDSATMPPTAAVVRLCGSAFGLDVRRHRLFATNTAMLVPPCAHHRQAPRFRSLDSRRSELATVVGVHGHLNYPGEAEIRNRAMGIDWMTQPELTQAIPPAYTEHLGRQLLAAL